ncbi:MAG: glucosamine-6-phosphate deaminase [Verrucomicrobiales bacterium]|jgi:glucosamine-6-phosphate deaminase
MQITVSSDRQSNGQAAATLGAKRLREVLEKRGEANVSVATGASQFEFLQALLREKDIAWDKVTFFHLDEYVGLPLTHPASFRKYLWKRLHSKLPVPPSVFHYVAGDGDAEEECRRLGALISDHPIDVCFAGVGENAHLAFNDPPADFETETPYLVVDLDEACRLQQLGEGWFSSLEEVPARAISMSIRQFLKSKCIIITAPDERKAKAIRDGIEGPVTNLVPCSILQQHADTHVFLDPASAGLLSQKPN